MLVDMPWLQELGANEVARWMERRGPLWAEGDLQIYEFTA